MSPLFVVSSSNNQNRGPPFLLTENVVKMATEFPRNTSVNFELCIICQTQTDEELVEKPVSHQKLFDAIEERSHYGDVKLTEVWSYLKGFSFEELEKCVSWHRKCYQETTHSGMIKRAKERYERELSGRNEARRKSCDLLSLEAKQPLTRSKTSPYNRDVCFFCDGVGGYRQPLHTVSTSTAGSSLDAAIKKEGDEKLHVKLSTSVDSKDAHAIDIKYHKNCWTKHVTNVLRKPSATSQIEQASEVAAKIEFVTMTEMALKSGKVMNMSQLQAAFDTISQENNVKGKSCSRKTIKKLIQAEVEGVEFHKSKRVNESERVSIKESRDVAIQLSETVDEDCTSNMKILYDAAVLLRKSINKCKKWVFTGSLETISKDNCPEELYCFYRWIIQGPNATLSAQEKCTEIHKRAMHLAQTTISMCLTERQVKNKKSETLQSTREMPEQLAVGLAVHQALRSKEIVNMLHGFRMSVEYNRLLRVESQIEAHVLQRLEQCGGVYLPPDIVKGRHVFFAIDNVDFAEDTCDGKGTLHGTAMAIYQRKEPDDEQPDLRYVVIPIKTLTAN